MGRKSNLALLLPPRRGTYSDGAPGMAGDMTLHEVCRDYVEYVASQQAPATQAHVRRAVALASELPDRPRTCDVEQWLARLCSVYPSRRSVGLYLSDVRCIVGWGNDSGRCTGNPFKLVTWERPPHQEPRAVRAIESDWPVIARVALDERERAFLMVMLLAGLRRGEALALERGGVDLSGRGSVSVYQQRRDHVLTPTPTLKTPSSRRVVPMVPELRRVMARLLAEPDMTIHLTRHRTPTRVPLLFPYRGDDMADLSKRLKTAHPAFAGRRAYHVFRHTFALRLRRAGASVSDVCRAMGHSSEVATLAYLAALEGRIVDGSVFDRLGALDEGSDCNCNSRHELDDTAAFRSEKTTADEVSR